MRANLKLFQFSFLLSFLFPSFFKDRIVILRTSGGCYVEILSSDLLIFHSSDKRLSPSQVIVVHRRKSISYERAKGRDLCLTHGGVRVERRAHHPFDLGQSLL